MEEKFSESKKNYRSNAFYLCLLLLIITIAYWPISFHAFSLKNDAINYFLPVRHLISESYYNHNLPLWTPYLNLGYPLHADMQSGVWNPFVILFSLFGPYTLYTLQLETLLYIYLSGVGMFFLLKHFSVRPDACIVASVAYMLCGYNSDSSQFLNWIASTSFLPFVFLFYYRTLKEKKINFAIYTGIALYFLLTCAYPADFIITTYILMALLSWHLIITLKEKAPLLLKRHFILHLIAVGIFLALSLPAILSYIQNLPLSERGSGASYKEAMTDPMHPAFLISYVTPLAVWKMPYFGITDPLTRNSFIGLFGFMLLLISFFSKSRTKLISFCKWAMLVFILFSFGEMGGLRKLAYHIFPLMNTFRHPANARMFFIFFSCLLAGFSFNSIIIKEIKKEAIKKILVITFIIMVGIFLWAAFTPFSFFTAGSIKKLFDAGGKNGFIQLLKEQLDRMSFADIVLLSLLIQFPFIYLFWRFLIKKPNPKLLAGAAITNCLIFTILFQPFTVVKNLKASYVQNLINQKSVKGYPVPDINKSILENSADNEKFMAEMGCLNLYNKKIGRSDYRITPSNLLVQNKFWFNEEFRNFMLRYPLIYKADGVRSTAQWNEITKEYPNLKWAFVDSGTSTNEYTSVANSRIVFTKFSPDNVEGEVTSDEGGMIVFIQNRHPRWKLYIDGSPQKILPVNIAFMGFELTEGTHQFAFKYESSDIKIAFIFSLAVAMAIIAYIIISKYKRT